MRYPRPLRAVALVAAAFACLLPVAGCGGAKTKKKGALTIEQRLKNARAEKTPENQARELTDVARLRFKAQDRSGAAQTLGEARQLVPDDGDPAVWAPRLIDIADAYALIGDKKLARGAADRAGVVIEKLEDPTSKAEFFAQLGGLYAAKDNGIGDTAKGRAALQKAEKLAKEEVPEGFRAKAQAAVATGYADAGLAAEAKGMIETLEETASTLEDLRRKAEALAVAATVRAASGEDAKAADLLGAATKAAKGIEGAANRTYALLAVGKAALAAGDKKLAKSLVTDAEKSAAKIGDPVQNAEAVQRVRDLERLVEKG